MIRPKINTARTAAPPAISRAVTASVISATHARAVRPPTSAPISAGNFSIVFPFRFCCALSCGRESSISQSFILSNIFLCAGKNFFWIVVFVLFVSQCSHALVILAGVMTNAKSRAAIGFCPSVSHCSHCFFKFKQ